MQKKGYHTIRFYQIRNNKLLNKDVDGLMHDILKGVRGSRDTRILRRLISRLLGPKPEDHHPPTIRSKKRIIATLEEFHVDATYRDLYCSQYARRHLTVPRFTYRLSFFDEFSTYHGPFEHKYSLVTWIGTPVESLQDAYLGSVVINPVAQTLICKAIIDPSVSMYWGTDTPDSQTARVVVPDEALMRLSTYAVNIAGKKLSVQAFPYHGQDGEALSCAEVTLLNLTRYYANEYNGYPLIEPSDILDAERQRAFSRVIPSTGLSYQTLCSILCDFGFRPELYDKNRLLQDRLKRDRMDSRSGESCLQQIIHTYLESGIPVAVNVEPKADPNNGHSLVLIGHGKPRKELERNAYENAILLRERRTKNTNSSQAEDSDFTTEDLGLTIRLLNTSDFYDTYVVMDDNQDPYSMRRFEDLSIHPEMDIARFIAPIQRGMTVDAMDALWYFGQILRDPANGITNWAGDWLKRIRSSKDPLGSDDSYMDVAMRVFLASTRRFKWNRTDRISNTWRAAIYAGVPLPRFVWVCELFLMDEFKTSFELSDVIDNEQPAAELNTRPHAFAEIILDATVSRTTAAEDAVLIKHFPDQIGYRMPNNTDKELSELTHEEMEEDILEHDGDYGLGFIPAYQENLMLVFSQHEAMIEETQA